jgi:hypothetical protein
MPLQQLLLLVPTSQPPLVSLLLVIQPPGFDRNELSRVRRLKSCVIDCRAAACSMNAVYW